MTHRTMNIKFVQILTTKDNDTHNDIYCIKLVTIFRSVLDIYVCPYAFNNINSLFMINLLAPEFYI